MQNKPKKFPPDFDPFSITGVSLNAAKPSIKSEDDQNRIEAIVSEHFPNAKVSWYLFNEGKLGVLNMQPSGQPDEVYKVAESLFFRLPSGKKF